MDREQIKQAAISCRSSLGSFTHSCQSLNAADAMLTDYGATIDHLQAKRDEDARKIEALTAERGELRQAAKTCLQAERERRKKLKPGAPATTYCEKRIAVIEAALAKGERHVCGLSGFQRGSEHDSPCPACVAIAKGEAK